MKEEAWTVMIRTVMKVPMILLLVRMTLRITKQKLKIPHLQYKVKVKNIWAKEMYMLNARD